MTSDGCEGGRQAEQTTMFLSWLYMWAVKPSIADQQ